MMTIVICRTTYAVFWFNKQHEFEKQKSSSSIERKQKILQAAGDIRRNSIFPVFSGTVIAYM
jgi:hypothetical protein